MMQIIKFTKWNDAPNQGDHFLDYKITIKDNDDEHVILVTVSDRLKSELINASINIEKFYIEKISNLNINLYVNYDCDEFEYHANDFPKNEYKFPKLVFRRNIIRDYMDLKKLTQIKIKNLQDQLISFKHSADKYLKIIEDIKTMLEDLKNKDIVPPAKIFARLNHVYDSSYDCCSYCENKFQWGDETTHYHDENNGIICKECTTFFKSLGVIQEG